MILSIVWRIYADSGGGGGGGVVLGGGVLSTEACSLWEGWGGFQLNIFFFSFSFRILMQQQSSYQTTSVMYNAFKNLPDLRDL